MALIGDRVVPMGPDPTTGHIHDDETNPMSTQPPAEAEAEREPGGARAPNPILRLLAEVEDVNGLLSGIVSRVAPGADRDDLGRSAVMSALVDLMARAEDRGEYGHLVHPNQLRELIYRTALGKARIRREVRGHLEPDLDTVVDRHDDAAGLRKLHVLEKLGDLFAEAEREVRPRYPGLVTELIYKIRSLKPYRGVVGFLLQRRGPTLSDEDLAATHAITTRTVRNVKGEVRRWLARRAADLPRQLERLEARPTTGPQAD